MRTYYNIFEAEFVERKNRFVATVLLDGKLETVHVKNTGRCKELLIPGCKVYLEKSDNPERKTQYDLVSVWKGNRLINMDSQLPNALAYEWILGGGLGFVPLVLRREVTYKDSRFDLYAEKEDGKQCFIEVKGVTLENQGIVRFPDAPTERGIKHMKGLMDALGNGYETYILFVVQMADVRFFAPNNETHPEFGRVLKCANAAGVKVLAVECEVTMDTVNITDFITIQLEEIYGI